MLKFVRRFQSTYTLVKTDLPTQATKVASAQKHLYELSEYRNDSLNQYFKEDALLFPVETITQRAEIKDYNFFLEQKNFLKVVDTLEKFEQTMLDPNSSKAREFAVFKRHLYQMYEVKNRSVEEHELYSFTVQRNNLRILYRANCQHIESVQDQDHQLEGYNSFHLKGKVFQRKLLNPARLQGLGALGISAGIYSYLPYLAVYLGSTVPLLTACAAGMVGLFNLGESNIVKSIQVIEEGELRGKLEFNVNITLLSSKKIVVDAKDVHSVVALDNDNQGSEDSGDNLLEIKGYIDPATGEKVDAQILLRLPADAYSRRDFMDWIISEKDNEGELADDFHNLLVERHLANLPISTNSLAVIAPPVQNQIGQISHQMLNTLIDSDHPEVDEKLIKLQERYGKEYLEKLEDSELYNLYKKHF